MFDRCSAIDAHSHQVEMCGQRIEEAVGADRELLRTWRTHHAPAERDVRGVAARERLHGATRRARHRVGEQYEMRAEIRVERSRVDRARDDVGP